MLNADALDRFSLALILAVSVHAVLILGVGFNLDLPKSTPHPHQSMEVIIVRHQTPPKVVEKPDFLAQTAQEGSGDTTDKTRPTVAAPAASLVRPSPNPRPEPEPDVKSDPVEAKAQAVVTRKQAASKAVTVQPQPQFQERKIRPSAAEILASSSQEIALLSAELDRKTKAYAQLPRRRHISASTQEYKYAAYLEAWRKKIERIGNLNYPDEAKRRKLHGNLVLHVAIQADGTVQRINVRKSSGYKILDDAAVRIVKLAAPFARFPEEIRKETDILDITRTWQFLDNNRLGWK